MECFTILGAKKDCWGRTRGVKMNDGKGCVTIKVVCFVNWSEQRFHMVDVGGWIIVTNCRKYISTTFGFVVHVFGPFSYYIFFNE